MSTMGLFSLIEDIPRKNEEEACNISQKDVVVYWCLMLSTSYEVPGSIHQ